MTTNATADTSNAPGFNRSVEELEKERATRALLKFLRPEFVNRVDEIISFKPLELETIRSIASIMISDLRKSLSLRSISLEVEEAVLDYLAEHGYDRKFGARSLKRTIQREVEDQIAQKMIDEYEKETSLVRCVMQDKKIIVDLQ